MEQQLFLFPTEESTSLPQAARVRISVLRENAPEGNKAVERAQASSSSLSALLAKYGPDGSSTKTWSECSLRTRDEISPTSSWRFGTAGIVSATGLWTRSMCEWTGWSVPSRRDGGVCGLSDILEPMSPRLRKYFLSPTALRGILRRADARGKALPALLRDAIEWMLGWWETQPQEEQGGGIDAIALDGDKLKPREDQRKGGNGFGINEDGAGYTLTGVDRHGVAYKSSNGKGEEVSATLSADDITQSGQGYVNNSVVQCYENHAQDSRIKQIDVSDTRNQKDGTGGNNLPLVCFSKVSHPTAPNGEGERWDEREVAQTRNTFDNGEDVAPTISSCEYKMGQKQKDTGGVRCDETGRSGR